MNFFRHFPPWPYNMDAVAGATGMFGQLAVGIAGGIPDNNMSPGMNNAVNKLAKIGQKPTIDSLPDKVRFSIFKYINTCVLE